MWAVWVPALRRSASRCIASGARLPRNAHRQLLDAADEARIDALRLADHLDAVETLQHFLPDDLQLQLGEAHADAAVDAEAERQMGAGPGAVDNEFVGLLDALFV